MRHEHRYIRSLLGSISLLASAINTREWLRKWIVLCGVWKKWKISIFAKCYQLLNKAIMYRSVNILFCLWFVSFLSSKFYHTKQFDPNDIWNCFYDIDPNFISTKPMGSFRIKLSLRLIDWIIGVTRIRVRQAKYDNPKTMLTHPWRRWF